MSGKGKPKIIRLSRFFQKNKEDKKRKNVFTELQATPYFPNFAPETSPYFSSLVSQRTCTGEIKKKKTRRKSDGPQLKGFTVDDMSFADNTKIEVTEAVARFEDKIKDFEPFRGFSLEEINISNSMSHNSRKLKRYLEKQRQQFLGFSEQDQKRSISDISHLQNACDSIRTDIYKNIDRRILINNIQPNNHSQKIVCSKYWSQDTKLPLKTEDKRWTKNCFMGDNLFHKNSQNVYTYGDINRLYRESVILAEIEKLNEELREIRKIKYANSEEAKLHHSPFIQTKRELIINPFIPPKSPHSLIEEELYHDPWALLASTIFLNKTSGRAARPYVFWFLEENPDPLTVIEKRVEQLETYFGAIGLQKTRATQIWRMSHDFLYKEWKKVGELYGIGRYAEDAFRMFCLGDFSAEPKDRYLKIYKAWYEMQEKEARKREMNS